VCVGIQNLVMSRPITRSHLGFNLDNGLGTVTWFLNHRWREYFREVGGAGGGARMDVPTLYKEFLVYFPCGAARSMRRRPTVRWFKSPEGQRR
jgi:hypothetical protein